MDTTQVVENILAHHGIKGMRWGVRSSSSTTGMSRTKKTVAVATGHNPKLSRQIQKEHSQSRSERKASKRLAKQDKKFDKRVTNPNKNFRLKMELHNATVDKMNDVHIPRINKKYAKAIDNGTLLNENHPTTKKYFKEVSDAYVKELNTAAEAMGTNASGTERYAVGAASADNPAAFGFHVGVIPVKSAKHANDSASFNVKFVKNDKGAVIGFILEDDSLTQSALLVEEILAHHGIKGQKWGIRRSRPTGPQAVTVGSKGLGGRKIKTKGGGGHPAHPDAVRARTHGQIAKKSGVKALSDKELQDYAKRLQLEASVKRLNYNEKPAAKRFVASVLGQSGKTQANELSNEASSKVKGALAKKAAKAAALAAA